MIHLQHLLKEVHRCNHCAEHLPLGPRPILQLERHSQILIIGQAPGRRVHESGIPWDDASGERLRDWLGLDRERFYDPRLIGIVPMGFCYPGSGTSGDLPPRPECAPLWHERLLAMMPAVRLTLLIGGFAQARYLQPAPGTNLTETVQAWRDFLPDRVPLPHPSPRNRIWLRRNPWFAEELLPVLRRLVQSILLEADTL